MLAWCVQDWRLFYRRIPKCTCDNMSWVFWIPPFAQGTSAFLWASLPMWKNSCSLPIGVYYEIVFSFMLSVKPYKVRFISEILPELFIGFLWHFLSVITTALFPGKFQLDSACHQGILSSFGRTLPMIPLLPSCGISSCLVVIQWLCTPCVKYCVLGLLVLLVLLACSHIRQWYSFLASATRTLAWAVALFFILSSRIASIKHLPGHQIGSILQVAVILDFWLWALPNSFSASGCILLLEYERWLSWKTLQRRSRKISDCIRQVAGDLSSQAKREVSRLLVIAPKPSKERWLSQKSRQRRDRIGEFNHVTPSVVALEPSCKRYLQLWKLTMELIELHVNVLEPSYEKYKSERAEIDRVKSLGVFLRLSCEKYLYKRLVKSSLRQYALHLGSERYHHVNDQRLIMSSIWLLISCQAMREDIAVCKSTCCLCERRG